MGLLHPKSSIRLTPASVGDRTEIAIIGKLLAVGYNVLKPINSALRYDLVIEDAEGQFWRVQCKTGRYRNGTLEWSTTTAKNGQGIYARRKYTSAEVDYYAIYCRELERVYFVPYSDVPGKIHGHLRVDPVSPGYKTPGRVRWAHDYEL